MSALKKGLETVKGYIALPGLHAYLERTQKKTNVFANTGAGIGLTNFTL